MPLILDSYDTGAETTLLSKARDELPANTSLVEIVDTETHVLLRIKPGSRDQEAMRTLMMRWAYAPDRHVTPGKQMPKRGITLVDAYQEICDELIKMDSPVSYRKAEALSKKGYPIDSAVLQTVLDAAKKQVFFNVVCASTSSYITHKETNKEGEEVYIGELVYYNVSVTFNKEPWVPPVVEPPSLPKNVFQKICSLFVRE